ncbi:LysR family transcriptional regulator [Alcaligenaceae bacterium]|nr:LysR family transcriptional regulator [Alcaligenaceae bacterium]
MAIDLRVLRNFVAVASSGSISRAAEVQYVAQPSLSQQMKRLEEDLGAPLFERHARGVVLTHSGERFLTHAVDILKRMDAACEDIRTMNSTPEGVVAIGMPLSIAKFLAVPVVQEVLERWPKVHLQFMEVGSASVPDDVLKGRLDIGLTFGMESDARLRFQHMLDEELVFYARPATLEAVLGPGGAQVKALKLEDLQAFPVILPTVGHSLRKRIDEYLDQEGVIFRVIAEVNTPPRLLELVQHGVGCTILSMASVDHAVLGERLRAVKITAPTMRRSVYSCKLATMPMTLAVASVQELMCATVERLTASGAWPCAYPEEG